MSSRKKKANLADASEAAREAAMKAFARKTARNPASLSFLKALVDDLVAREATKRVTRKVARDADDSAIDQISAADERIINILDEQQTDYEQPEGAHDVEQPLLGQISIDNVSRGKIDRVWMFLVLNCLIEITSAVFDQISSKRKPIYALMAMIMSFIATLLCIIELAYKAGKIRVVWEWEKSKLPWFYHQSPRNKRFGTFPEIVGLVCAILQSIVSAIIYGMYLHHADYPIKISFWPIIFSFGLLCSKFMENKDHNDILCHTPSQRFASMTTATQVTFPP